MGAHTTHMNNATVLGVDSLSFFFNHRSFQKPDLFPRGFGWFFRKKDAWKEWGSVSGWLLNMLLGKAPVGGKLVVHQVHGFATVSPCCQECLEQRNIVGARSVSFRMSLGMSVDSFARLQIGTWGSL